MSLETAEVGGEMSGDIVTSSAPQFTAEGLLIPPGTLRGSVMRAVGMIMNDVDFAPTDEGMLFDVPADIAEDVASTDVPAPDAEGNLLLPNPWIAPVALTMAEYGEDARKRRVAVSIVDQISFDAAFIALAAMWAEQHDPETAALLSQITASVVPQSV